MAVGVGALDDREDCGECFPRCDSVPGLGLGRFVDSVHGDWRRGRSEGSEVFDEFLKVEVEDFGLIIEVLVLWVRGFDAEGRGLRDGGTRIALFEI